MSRLFELFTSEYIRLTLKKNSRQSIEHNDTIKVIENPMFIEGYFTEEDDIYYFLGIEPDQINIAVNINEVSTVEICDPNEIRDDLLNDFANRTGKGGMN